MNTHLDTGKQGEDIAADYLENKNYRIVARNYRAGRGEIDLIAWENEHTPDKTLVFVEVKTRSDERFGGPEGAIDAKKQENVVRAAGAYMESIGYEWIIRFDVIAIVLRQDALLELRHIEDAFFPGMP